MKRSKEVVMGTNDAGVLADAPSVTLEQEAAYRFAMQFGRGIPVMYADEDAPLGQGAGPTPIQLLAAAVANCLSASLYFALKKFHESPEPITASAFAQAGRNERNRLRVRRIAVRIALGAPAASFTHLDRALAQFEDFCTVTASVREAIDVAVEVYDSEGVRVK
jgi:uncharacterized OsmC-like protein